MPTKPVIRLLTVFSLLCLAACTPNSSTPTKQFEHAQDGAFAASLSYSGQFAVVSSLYHGVALWDLKQNGLKYIWQQTPEGDAPTFEDGESTAIMESANMVFATAISHNDSHAVLADKSAFSLWRIDNGENVGYWRVKQSKIRYLDETAAGYWKNRATRGKSQVKDLDYEVLDPNACVAPNPNQNEACITIGRIRAIDVSKDGNHILLGKSNGVAVHISVNSGRRIEFNGHLSELTDENGEIIHVNNAINSVALSPNGRYALTGSSDQNAYLWDTRTGQVIHKFRHGARVVQVALDPKARLAFSADSRGQANIWDLKTGKARSSLQYINRQEVFTTARFSNNGQWLVTGAPNRELSLWDINTGIFFQIRRVTPRKGSRPASAVVYSAAFINDDRQIVTESSAGLNEVWDIKRD